MQAIYDFIEGITGTIEAVWNFFGSIINNLKMLVEYIGLASSTAYNLVATLPTWLQALATATILISILYIILGREAGGNSD